MERLQDQTVGLQVLASPFCLVNFRVQVDPLKNMYLRLEKHQLLRVRHLILQELIRKLKTAFQNSEYIFLWRLSLPFMWSTFSHRFQQAKLIATTISYGDFNTHILKQNFNPSTSSKKQGSHVGLTPFIGQLFLIGIIPLACMKL